MLVSALALGCAGAPENIPPDPAYEQAVERLREFIEHEMADKGLPALSIALVDDQRTVWAQGFGLEDPGDSVSATARTVYRVGSVSKLFTDIGVMQLVERGELDLDAPVATYVPDFQPRDPYGEAVTLRQLMSHRSGLVREPPRGNYFDDQPPLLAATVASLNETGLVYPPTSRTKYSNAGIATVGYVLEHAKGQPFADYLAASVLEPLGLRSSSFAPTPDIRGRLATAYMWSYHGDPFVAPTFELGMMPAGSMYAPVTDLARFLSALFVGGGLGADGGVLGSEALAEMLTPQFAPADATTGFGLGFAMSELDGHRVIRHGGAIYGFATELAALPDERLGAVAVTTMDGANAVVERIVAYALRLMLAVQSGEPLPSAEVSEPLPDGMAQDLEGRYVGAEQVVELRDRPTGLFAWLRQPGVRVRLRAKGSTLVADDRLAWGPEVTPLDDAIVLGADTLRRISEGTPDPAPDRWAGLIGEYGWDHNVLYVLEKDGALHALIEWFFLYPLTEVEPDVFAFPQWGLYDGEQLVFSRDESGRATQVEAASVVFPRRAVGTEGGETFTITPVAPVEELRRAALAATPPEESGSFREPTLVELQVLDPTIRYDIRYATTNNFMEDVFYDEPHAFLQRPAAEALVRAHRALREHGYGLLIHDAYRPWYVTKMFWDATPAEFKNFVADPSQGSRHNRGAAADLTLYDLRTGAPVTMVGGYDEFSERSYPRYLGGTSLQRWLRELVRDAMEAEGFSVYEYEWWHFDFGDWHAYPILNLRFDELATVQAGPR
jgi:CubicO group peptidase (beta-lactamase class C family)/D-alanyl-D-alanine dipeptidase